MESSEPPRYVAIAAQLRTRIANGDLAIGQRVPSTRQVAREFGVALDTALKALEVLRAEELIVTRPRSGSVVAAPRQRRRPQRVSRELKRGHVIEQAVAIADEAGLAAVSMRAVAKRCGVAPMTLYRYVDGKETLILEMADSIYGSVSLPENDSRSWRVQVESLTGELWELHQRHPWMAQLHPLTRPLPIPNLLAIGDRILGALGSLELPPKVLFDCYVLIYNHVVGLAANLEPEDAAVSETGVSSEEWADLQYQARVRSEQAALLYPNLASLFGPLGELEDGYDLNLNELFRLGLRLLLDGIESMASAGHD